MARPETTDADATSERTHPERASPSTPSDGGAGGGEAFIDPRRSVGSARDATGAGTAEHATQRRAAPDGGGEAFDDPAARQLRTEVEQGQKLPDSRIQTPPSVRGRAPIGDDSYPVELHHRNQRPDSVLDEMTRTDHRGKGNFVRNHENVGQEPSAIDRAAWAKERRQYWEQEWDQGRWEGWSK